MAVRMVLRKVVVVDWDRVVGAFDGLVGPAAVALGWEALADRLVGWP